MMNGRPSSESAEKIIFFCHSFRTVTKIQAEKILKSCVVMSVSRLKTVTCRLTEQTIRNSMNKQSPFNEDFVLETKWRKKWEEEKWLTMYTAKLKLAEL